LLNYDFGVYISPAYKGTRIATVEEFLRVCSETGMEPIFSVHQDFDRSTWTTIKKWLVRFNLISKTTIKSGILSVLVGAFDVLGNDVYAYVHDIEDGNISNLIETIQSSNLNNATCKIGIEISSAYITEEKISAVINAGYFAGMYDVFTLTSRLYKQYMYWGVSEIVDDYNPSYGLHW
jgi:hypothetical protein